MSIPAENDEDLQNLDLQGLEMLLPMWKIGNVFQDDPFEDHAHIIVKFPAPKRRLEIEDYSVKHLEFIQAQGDNVTLRREAGPPSSAAAMPAFITEQDHRPVLNGRPHKNSGPSIGLFHPAFNLFQVEMKKLSPDPSTYPTVRELLRISADILLEIKNEIGMGGSILITKQVSPIVNTYIC